MQNTFKQYLIAARPWALPASTMPALVAISYVFLIRHELLNINWWYGVLALFGAAIFQTAGNLISDYFDYKYGVDRTETFGSSRMLVDKVFSPKTILRYGLILLLIGCLIGIYFLFNTSYNLLGIGLIGVFCTFFYYKLKFNALGDLTIFIIYGQLIALGTYLVMTNQLRGNILLISASLGFLIINILHANNTRDIKHDGEANIKTQAMVLGVKKSITQYILLSYGAYFIILLCVVLGILHWLSLIVFITLPVLLKNIKVMKTAQVEKPELIKDMDAATAQLVMMFSLLLAISNFAAGLIFK